MTGTEKDLRIFLSYLCLLSKAVPLDQENGNIITNTVIPTIVSFDESLVSNIQLGFLLFFHSFILSYYSFIHFSLLNSFSFFSQSNFFFRK